ncbi:hypothetical protein [Neobacillus notoginsengisoli]|uniref:hypothetical protein n=1 Tax=Neobacillus notoginsengisoli TaxID=1578198 RepID=UPI00131439B4|nr:hypothetical protein [Neobacillus notoginsengisoli]
MNKPLDPVEELLLKIRELESQVSRMEGRIEELEQIYGHYSGGTHSSLNGHDGSGGENPGASQPAVIYQEIKVERLFIDKFDQITNLGNVGIRELGGQLNIGTTFEGEAIPAESAKEMEEDHKKIKDIFEKFKQKTKITEDSDQKE